MVEPGGHGTYFFRLLFCGTGVACSVAGSVLICWSNLQTKVDQARIQEWFGKRWAALENSSWGSLPDKVIRVLIRNRDRFSSPTFLLRSIGLSLLTQILTPVALGLGLWIDASRVHESAIYRWLIPLVALVLGEVVAVAAWRTLNLGIVTIFTLFEAWTALVWLGIALAIPLRYGVLVSFALLPTLTVCSAISGLTLGAIVSQHRHTREWRELLHRAYAAAASSDNPPEISFVAKWANADDFYRIYRISDEAALEPSPLTGSPEVERLVGKPMERSQNAGTLLGMSVSFSFFVTFFALWAGHTFAASGWVPQTAQMLISNALLDGLTILTTLSILEKASGAQPRYSIPLAVALDLSLASIFALLSLWFGLLGTRHSVGLAQAAWVFLGHSTDGARWNFGPLFWVMHTTFIPTLFYLIFVLSCWLAKGILALTRLFFAKGHHPDINPVRMTAGFIGVMGALSGLACFALGFLR